MRINRLLPLFLGVAALATTLVGCSDDNDDPIVEDKDIANVREADATYNSLTFAWDAVKGVNQYGYELDDPSGETIYDGLTDLTSVTLEDLVLETTYTFRLYAYGPAGEATYRTELKATTLGIQQLATPVVEAAQQGNAVRLTWDAIKGAGSYSVGYTIGTLPLTTETAETECLIAGLAPGTHTLTVTALPADGGYTPSETTSVSATRSRSEIATVSGTYTSGLIRRNNSWTTTMHIFDDGSYIIDAFYQNAPGLDFYVDTTSGDTPFIGVYNFASILAPNDYLVDTGRESVPQIEILSGMSDSGQYQSTFTGDNTSGTVTFTTVYSTASGTDKFEW